MITTHKGLASGAMTAGCIQEERQFSLFINDGTGTQTACLTLTADEAFDLGEWLVNASIGECLANGETRTASQIIAEATARYAVVDSAAKQEGSK
jgi:hypothetical protein